MTIKTNEETGSVRQPDEGGIMVKKILVKEVHALQGTASITIPDDATLEYAISRLANEPGCRGVFLVDNQQRFSGIISRSAIMKWAEFQLFSKWKSAASKEILETIGNVKAKSLARGDWRSLGVLESDKLQKAFDQMMLYNEDVIPVLDADGKIIGDLRLSEVLLKVIDLIREG